MAKPYRLPTKPLNPISRTAADSTFPAVIVITGTVAVVAFGTFLLGALLNTSAWTLNTTFLSLALFFAATSGTAALMRAKLTVEVGYHAGLVGAIRKVSPALVYKALPLYDAGLKIMVSEHTCGGNEVMREMVGERVKKIRELSTAHEAAQIHTLGDHDLNNASTLIENLTRPALEAAKSKEQKAAAEKTREAEAAARYQARQDAARAAKTVEPDEIISKYTRVELKNQDKDREKAK